MLKRLLRSAFGRELASWVLAWTIRAIAWTIRWRTVNPEYERSAVSEGGPVIVAFWHNRIMMMPFIRPAGQTCAMLQSRHADGRLIGRTVERLGISGIVGSTGKDGAQGLRQLIKALKDGQHVGITPDGPRGPRMRASPGIVTLARLSGARIYPLSWGVSRRKALNSWDRFVLALPFGRGVFIWGEPLAVPRDADDAELERLRLELEERLNRITAEADHAVGQVPIQPAEPRPVSGTRRTEASGA